MNVISRGLLELHSSVEMRRMRSTRVESVPGPDWALRIGCRQVFVWIVNIQ